MSQKLTNTSPHPNHTLQQSINLQPQQNNSEKQEISQQIHQNIHQIPQENSQNNLISEQSKQNSQSNPQLQQADQLELNLQDSNELSSRNQNYNKNNIFNPLNIQKIPSCHCKKSKCLKMYCDCFAKGNKCRDTCKCIGCENTKNSNRQKKPDYRNDEEIERSSDSNKKSLKPKERSCNCKKSFCLKKYCECYNANIPCGQICKCQDCKNNGQNNNFRDDKTQGNIPVIDPSFYNSAIARPISQGISQQNGIIEKKEQLSAKKRQKPDEDQIETKISQILKLIPQQKNQTMLDFLAYCLS